jgi:hypothetical protein
MHVYDISALIILKFFAYKNGSQETKTIIAIQLGAVIQETNKAMN